MVITLSRFWSSLVILAALCLPLASSHAAPDPLHPVGPPALMQAPGADRLIVAQAGSIVPAIPGVPFSLRAVVASSTQINLTWTDASTNESGFQIQRKIGSGAWRALATVGRNATTYANAGLVPSTTYSYRVRAFDRSGNSAWSNIASAKTPSGSVAPPAPSDLVVNAVPDWSRLILSWRDNSRNETLFKIERWWIGTGAWTQIATVGANVTTYANTGLIPSTLYCYRVRAANARLNSVYSNEICTITMDPTPPSRPTDLTAAAVSSSQINLTWRDNSSNENGFSVESERDVLGDGSLMWVQIAWLDSNQTSYSDRSLKAGTTYRYRVWACNHAAVCSPWSNTASATTLPGSAAPTAPRSLTAAAMPGNQINLAWTDASTNETGFKIERKTSTGAWSQIATVGTNVTAYSDPGLAASTAYSYRVRATNAVGDSAYSNEASATTPGIPTVPVGLTATAMSSTQISLAWTDSSTNETGFKIERKTGTGAWSEIVTVAANVVAYPNTGLAASTLYIYRVRSCNAAGCSGYSNEASATTQGGGVPQLRLNDTGIDWCADGIRNNLPCPVTSHPEQDAQFGRDSTANDDSDGQAGFSFIKLDANGNALPASATGWSCVRDNVTGRVWEEKTIDGGLRDKEWTYTWYNTNTATNGGSAGTANGGSCAGSRCDTQGYVEAVNAAGLCGARDWRMPTVSELLSIVSNDRVGPSIDTLFFRNMHTFSPGFWSTNSAHLSNSAWYVYFINGNVDSTGKTNKMKVRLVRGAQ